MRVDLKSIVLGAILMLVLFILTGQIQIFGVSKNRFQVIMSVGNISPLGSIFLDTKTGKTFKFSGKEWISIPFESKEKSD